jgi:exosortase/archaeosortase family protein
MTSTSFEAVRAAALPEYVPVDRRGAVARAALTALVIALAHRYSLATAVRELGGNTPLAFLGLAPLLGLIGIARYRPPASSALVPQDRTIDWILGVAAVAFAFWATLAFQPHFSILYWERRYDLALLPVFAAGAVLLLLGSRALWHLRWPLLALLAAWPRPWHVVLGPVLDATTWLTLHGVRILGPLTGTARPLPGDGSMFELRHGADVFPVSVASPCSGVNGAIGFALVGGTFLLAANGPRRNKAIWLGAGLVVTVLGNMVRILTLFAVGTHAGPQAAFDLLHPVAGIVTLAVVGLTMVLLAPWFGLSVPARTTAAGTGPARERRVAPKWQSATVALVALTAILTVNNGDLSRYDPVLSDLGAPRLVAFSQSPSLSGRWLAGTPELITWAQPYFGRSATWQRLRIADTVTGGSTVVDTVTTADLRSFERYSIRNCYDFHGFDPGRSRRTDLGNGVVATVFPFRYDGAAWTMTTWIWPVATPEGRRYERLALFRTGAGAETETALADLARAIVAGRPAATAPTS